jgi:hypothetical protein
VLFCEIRATCVLYLIVVPLPQGKNQFAVQINSSNNKSYAFTHYAILLRIVEAAFILGRLKDCVFGPIIRRKPQYTNNLHIQSIGVTDSFSDSWKPTTVGCTG